MKRNYPFLKKAYTAFAAVLLFSFNNSQAQLTTQTFSYTGAIQTFTVPSWCVSTLTIEARGAQGGDNVTLVNMGGKGALMSGQFTVTAGQILNIIVGGRGANNLGGNVANGAGGGGGGSFVYLTGAPQPMIVAGGGGGSSLLNNGIPNYYGKDASITTSGTGSRSHDLFGNSPGGSNGSDGNTVCGSGGKGWNTVMNNPAGMPAGNVTYGAAGGFGGGGGAGTAPNAGNSLHTAGGGGGYSGGGAGGTDYYHGGGGGGSYNAGTNQVNTPGVQTGDGLVTISYDHTGVINPSFGAPFLCEGSTATISAVPAQVSYTWSTGPNTNTPSIVVSPLVNTTYTVYGIDSQGCNSLGVITVTVKPVPNVSSYALPQVLCVGNSATLTGQGASTYTWAGEAPSPTVVVSPSLTTSYTLTGTGINGCDNTSVLTVNVNTNTLSVSANTVICKGSSITLTAGGAVSYNWNGNFLFPNITVTPTVSTVYNVNAVDANNCALSQTVSVDVSNPPNVAATAIRTVICKGESLTLNASGATTYSWSTGSASTSIVISPTVDILYNYYVIGTNTTGCSSTSYISVKVNGCVGIAEPENIFKNNLSVYPNPNDGAFVVTSQTNLSLKLVNQLGQVVKLFELSESNGHRYSFTDISPGIYFITPQNAGASTGYKIVVGK